MRRRFLALAPLYYQLTLGLKIQLHTLSAPMTTAWVKVKPIKAKASTALQRGLCKPADKRKQVIRARLLAMEAQQFKAHAADLRASHQPVSLLDVLANQPFLKFTVMPVCSAPHPFHDGCTT
jgi:hypothetical protein